ncbi:MAG: hypothetical protein AB4062_02690 [Crocosphaera sp.]
MDLETTKISHLSLEEDEDNQLIVKLLENYLLTAKSPEEIKMYLEIYENFIEQNTLLKVARNQQFMERFQIIRQTSMWGIIISIGVALIIARMTILGISLILIVFYDFVIDYSQFRKNKTQPTKK